MRSRAGALITAALVAACGGGDVAIGPGGGELGTVRCLWDGDMCDQFTAVMTSTQEGSLGSSCEGWGGTFGVGTCPTTAALAGYCRYEGSALVSYTGVSIADAEMNEYFYSPLWLPADAQANCASAPAGTWVP